MEGVRGVRGCKQEPLGRCPAPAPGMLARKVKLIPSRRPGTIPASGTVARYDTAMHLNRKVAKALAQNVGMEAVAELHI